MTEFNEIDLAKDVSDMEGDEARETLADFMQTHEANVEAVDELRSQYAETIEGLESEKEDLQEKVAEFTQERAAEAAEFVNIPADLLVDRFSLDEIEQIIEEGEEYSETNEVEEEEDRLTTFADREEKGKQEKEETRPARYRDDARERLGQKLGIEFEA